MDVGGRSGEWLAGGARPDAKSNSLGNENISKLWGLWCDNRLDFKIDFQACAIEIYGKLRDKPLLYIPETSHVSHLDTKEISMSHAWPCRCPERVLAWLDTKFQYAPNQTANKSLPRLAEGTPGLT